jgi:hypothetical protein
MAASHPAGGTAKIRCATAQVAVNNRFNSPDVTMFIIASHNNLTTAAHALTLWRNDGSLGAVENSIALYFRGDVGGDPVHFRYIDNSGAAASIGVQTAGTYVTNWMTALCGGGSLTGGMFMSVDGGTTTSATNTNVSPPSVTHLGINCMGNFDASESTELLVGETAHAAIWNAFLTADERNALAKRCSPKKVRPQSLIFYAPLVRAVYDLKGQLPLTVEGTTGVAPHHPRIYGGF